MRAELGSGRTSQSERGVGVMIGNRGSGKGKGSGTVRGETNI